jgi:hypothetical protein
MYEEYDEYEYDEYYEDGLTDEEVHAILEEYRKKKLRESCVGPVFSFAFHAILLILLSVFVVAKYVEETPAVEISIEEIEIKEITEPVEIELDEVEPEEMVEDEAPVMEAPDIPAETQDVAFEDFNDEAPETDDSLDFEEILDVVANPTPLKLPGLYGGRSESGRAGSVHKHGGTEKGQDAVLKALRWLAKVQEDNGSWVDRPERTGMALLCFLAYGATPLDEEFGTTVQKAMQWLTNNMPADGMFGGRSYSHGIATYAVAEAYGMTHIPFLKEAMENGISTIVDGQQADGGYDYRYSKGARWDLSVAGWQYQAMKAAYVAGSSNEKLYDAIEKSKKFLKNTAYSQYRFNYGAGKANENMTGVGVVALQLLGDPNAREVSGAMNTLLEKRLQGYKWENASKKLYGWYYDTQAVFQYGSLNDKNAWKAWRPVFEGVLVKNQHPEGYWETAESHQMWGPSLSGRVLSTTFCCLQLEVYYRYLPTFKIQKGFTTEVKSITDVEDVDLIIE